MTDQLRNLADEMKGMRITVPESFADDVMSKIALQKEGSLRSMSVPSRILISTILIVVYCSLGILLGAKSYRNLSPDMESSSDQALVELMESHHINSTFIQDQLFRSMNSTN